jgi:NAD(P)-dependent dehydrogenase (short-subunit alcohol dehydrogenase family)
MTSTTDDTSTCTFAHSSLKGKVAIITGSTQGLGEATARLFHARGVRGLIITGRNPERGQAVADSLCDDVTTARFVQADLANVQDCHKIVRAADDEFGTLHILVNSAALTARGSIWDTTPELYDRMMNINTRAPFFLMQGAARIMEREIVQGSIVNVSSNASYGSMPMLAPYAISKGALNVATKNAAYALMRSRIRVNALAIGWMDTPGEDVVQRQYHDDGSGNNWRSEAEASLPFGRLLEPSEVARAIAFLCSDESGMMTGCVMDFDQSVWGGGPASIPPPKEEWTQAKGVSYSFNDEKKK